MPHHRWLCLLWVAERVPHPSPADGSRAPCSLAPAPSAPPRHLRATLGSAQMAHTKISQSRTCAGVLIKAVSSLVQNVTNSSLESMDTTPPPPLEAGLAIIMATFAVRAIINPLGLNVILGLDPPDSREPQSLTSRAPNLPIVRMGPRKARPPLHPNLSQNSPPKRALVNLR